MDLTNHIREELKYRASRSPSLTYKELGKEFRLSITSEGRKQTFLIDKSIENVFSEQHLDWKTFVQIKEMSGARYYVLIENLAQWIQLKACPYQLA